MNYKMIRNILGWILLFEAAFMSVPLVTALICREWKEALTFVGVILLCAAVGGIFVRFKASNKALYAKEGFVVVSLSWIVLSLFGALPFVLSGHIPNYIDALFETASGFSTTGASILSNVEALPYSLLMWRAFTHWVGGMGVLVFLIAFLPLSGGQNMNIMKAESPGPSVGKLVPRVRTTALLLYSIYLLFTFLQFILLLFGGLSVFDALTISFSTAGTGGFSTLNTGFSSYSVYVQIVVTVFMLLFSVNFNSYFLLWRKKPREAFNSEVRTFVFVVACAIAIITVDVMQSNLFDTVGEGLLHAAFSVSSIISTTGFASADFNLWPAFSKTVIVMLMFIGACAGSTGGGIKVSRFVIAFKSILREISGQRNPNQVNKATVDGRGVDYRAERSVLVFFLAYVFVFAFSLLLICVEGKDMGTSFTAVSATLNNVGPGIGEVGPMGNYGGFSSFSKLVLIFDMLAGRLELFPMLLLFSPKTWKK